MVAITLKCPFCGSEDVRPYGTSNGKKRYTCNNPECSHKTFYGEYSYNGCKPEVKQAIIKWAVDGAGIRATARELGVSADTVIKEIKSTFYPIKTSPFVWNGRNVEFLSR